MTCTACRLPDGRLLTASDRGFAVRDGDRTLVSASLAQVARVVVWQKDMFAYDHVYADIILTDGQSVIIDEDMRGFRHLMDTLATLPGFDPDWWSKVILPPFASNELVAYERAQPSETS